MHYNPLILQIWKRRSKGKWLAQNHASNWVQTELRLGVSWLYSTELPLPRKGVLQEARLKLFYKNLAHSHILNMGFWFEYLAVVEAVEIDNWSLSLCWSATQLTAWFNPEPEVFMFVLASQWPFRPCWENILKPPWRGSELNFLSICAL